VSVALGTAAVILVVLLWELTRPKVRHTVTRLRLLQAARTLNGTPRRAHPEGRTQKGAGRQAGWRAAAQSGYDPGRELRAEQRARALLRSCIDADDWAMYRDLGFLRVWGRLGERGAQRSHGAASPGDREAARPVGEERATSRSAGEHAPYAYLIYPHKPIVAYLPDSGVLLNEYCVAFPDDSRPYGSSRLPDSDDVLAKWMALTGDERLLLADANMHLPGRQVDPDRVRRDLTRLAQWDRERSPARVQRGRGRVQRSPGQAGSVPAA
jgi:hypothetical protein